MNATESARVRGCIFDIQHASFVDGPGMRSVVFLKGCPLRCLWCHNPEGIRSAPEPLRRGSEAIEWCGREVSAQEIIEEITGEADYYAATGGGLTVSGGEPLFQPAFAEALLAGAHARGIHTCLDTSGCAPRKTFERVLPFTDLVLFDYKATGTALHNKLTGATPSIILKNLKLLRERRIPVILRCPMVPGVNDTEVHFEAMACLAAKNPNIRQVDILPYHPWGRGKPKPFWCEDQELNLPTVNEHDKERWNTLLAKTGNTKASIL
jgi:pyruvate formate lyase activating enzyme